MNTEEIWRPVADWPYDVSDCGRVRRGAPGKGTTSGHVLRPKHNKKNGYDYVSLSKGGTVWFVTVHTLVAAAFIGPRPYKAVVNHKDARRANNRADNLEYTTQRENVGHAVRMGLQPIGERHPNAKLRTVDVVAIRACIATGKSDGDIARFFGVRPETISKIARGELWADAHL